MLNPGAAENLVQWFCSARSRFLDEFSVANKRSALVLCEGFAVLTISGFSGKMIPLIGTKILDHYTVSGSHHGLLAPAGHSTDSAV